MSKMKRTIIAMALVCLALSSRAQTPDITWTWDAPDCTKEVVMPIIQYKCGQGHVTEHLFRKQSEAEGIDWIVCATCAEIADRVLAVTSPPQFVGTGFYATDYKGKP